MRCDNCGVESPLRSGFSKSLKSFKFGKKTVCILCARREADLFSIFAILFAISGLCVTYGLTRMNSGAGALSATDFAFPLNMQVVFLLQLACIVPHELGHTVAGWWGNFAIWRVCIGRGRLLISRRVRGTDFELRLLPVYGVVEATTGDFDGWRKKRLLFYMAGPLANVLLFLVGASFYVAWSFQSTDWPMKAINVPADLCVASAILLWYSLRPKKADHVIRHHSSDGKQILGLLRNTVATNESANRRAHFLRCVFRLTGDGNHAAAMQLCSQLLEENESDLACRMNFSLVLSAAGQFARARDILSNMLETYTEPNKFRASLCNLLAWNDLSSMDPQLQAEANRCSLEAYSIAPWEPHILSTRGRTLIEAGEVEPGIALLQRSLREVYEPNNRATVLCSLALGRYKQGKHRKAVRHLARARKLDPKCDLLAVTERRVRDQTH